MKKYNILAFLGIMFILAGALLGAYVGGYCMFIQPIFETAKAYDAGLMTGMMVATTVLKCIFATPIGSLIFSIGYIICVTLIYKE